MNIGRTVGVFTAEPVVSPVPGDEQAPRIAGEHVTEPVPEPAESLPTPSAPARTPATATR